MSQVITFKEAFRYWLKLGFISFGGPTGQIAMMHKDIVEKRRWIDEAHFLQALNFCMLLPGPEAQQLATYIGFLMHRAWGGIVAGVCFVLPSVFILWGLSWLYASFGSVPSVAALFYGLKPAVTAIVAEAVIRIGKKSLRNGFLVALAALAFVGIYFLHIPFPLIVLSAGIMGYIGGIYMPSRLASSSNNNQNSSIEPILRESMLRMIPSWQRSIKVAALCLTLWFAPIAVLGAWKGWGHIFVEIGILFSKAAVVTFGGAYAVLSYISQQAVTHYGWLSPEQMMDGLGLAETTPGPLIMVNQFVGYLAAFTHAVDMSPALAGAIGGLLTTWVTFVPSFLMIFVGAPFIERIRGNVKLGAALAAITASVVGVVLNLGVNFTYHTLFPDTDAFDWFALAVSVIAFIGMTRFKWGMMLVIAGSAVAGFIFKTIL